MLGDFDHDQFVGPTSSWKIRYQLRVAVAREQLQHLHRRGRGAVEDDLAADELGLAAEPRWRAAAVDDAALLEAAVDELLAVELDADVFKAAALPTDHGFRPSPRLSTTGIRRSIRQCRLSAPSTADPSPTRPNGGRPSLGSPTLRRVAPPALTADVARYRRRPRRGPPSRERPRPLVAAGDRHRDPVFTPGDGAERRVTLNAVPAAVPSRALNASGDRAGTPNSSNDS